MYKEYLEYKDGALLWKKKPARNIAVGSIAGCVRDHNGLKRRSLTLRGTRILTSHVVWYIHHGYKPEMLDHKDTDTLNDKIENLRECTQQQNRMNQGKSAGASGYKGVHWANGVWVATIKLNGKRENILYNKDPKVCALAYDKRATELFGEFVNTNF